MSDYALAGLTKDVGHLSISIAAESTLLKSIVNIIHKVNSELPDDAAKIPFTVSGVWGIEATVTEIFPRLSEDYLRSDSVQTILTEFRDLCIDAIHTGSTNLDLDALEVTAMQTRARFLKLQQTVSPILQSFVTQYNAELQRSGIDITYGTTTGDLLQLCRMYDEDYRTVWHVTDLTVEARTAFLQFYYQHHKPKATLECLEKIRNELNGLPKNHAMKLGRTLGFVDSALALLNLAIEAELMNLVNNKL